MSPLGFDAKKMYNFVAKRFVNTCAKVQEQALNWLQTLTMLEISIPLCQLFSMFSDGVAVMGAMNSTESEQKPSKGTKKEDDEGNAICNFEFLKPCYFLRRYLFISSFIHLQVPWSKTNRGNRRHCPTTWSRHRGTWNSPPMPNSICLVAFSC